MTITLIIGKDSNLSKYLVNTIDNSILISSRELQQNIDILSEYKEKKINLIFNNFQSSTLLNKLDNSVEYISNTILVTAKILEYFRGCNISKIIYTSSSSVYGNNISCKESDTLKPLNLHASLKVANEKLIEKYSSERNIDYSITRIFNMYGGEDRFSIISKILKAIKSKKAITIVNHGNAIRDFIYIEDVAAIYKKILTTNVKIINIGTGEGVSIKTLIDFLSNRGITLKVNNISKDELKISTADTVLLSKLIGIISFKHVEEYLVKELKL